MKKEIDYKWHDVRKTPIDLPIEKEKVIVCYLVNNSKFKTFPGFTEGIAKEGFIGLQDHGWPVSFRNIKIREL